MGRREKNVRTDEVAFVVLAIENPDGTETEVTVPVDTTLTMQAPFSVEHDRFRVSGEVRVPVRLVRIGVQ